jgi:hypothetical protein
LKNNQNNFSHIIATSPDKENHQLNKENHQTTFKENNNKNPEKYSSLTKDPQNTNQNYKNSSPIPRI